MECADIQRALLAGHMPEGSAVSAHLEACPACTELMSDGGALARQLAAASREGDAAPALDELFSRLERRLGAERGLRAWLRSRPTETRVSLGLAAALLAIGELVRKARPDLAVYPLSTMLVEVSVYGLALGLAVHFALRPLHRRAPPDWATGAVALLALAVPIAAALHAPAHVAHPASLEGLGDAFVPRALGCFGFGATMAAVMLVVLRALDRGAHRALPIVLVAAALAGLAGNLALHLHCPITHPEHLLAGHAAIGFALLVAYGAVAHVLAQRDA